LSSHILPEVSQICQRILIINNGQIIATDTPANLITQLQDNLQIHLEVEGPRSEIIEKLGGVAGVLTVQPTNTESTYVIECERGQDVRSELARTVVEHGWQLRELKLQDLSLEEIFMQLVTDEEPEEK
jgi:ABC-2 type transport system ATP-binding protein